MTSMTQLDVKTLAAASKRPVLVSLIATLKAERKAIEDRLLGPFDHTAERFIAREEMRCALEAGHTITWEFLPVPANDPDQLQRDFDQLGKRLDAAEEEERVLQEISVRGT
jgi:hypothetical protein